jgi:uncharacterized protein YecE (DUF72 family)
MSGHMLSVEFRHRTWFDGEHQQDTLAFERELGVVHTIVDEPQGFTNSVPAIWEATHPSYALVRLHGRNAATWNVKGATTASDRFNYDYSDVELGDIAASIRRMLPPLLQTHVIFNNNMDDQGQRNARTLMAKLDMGQRIT